MKKTKIMIAVIATFIITVLLINTIVWYLQEDSWTFKMCMSHGATMMVSFLFGWIPAIFVGYDLNERFEKDL